MANNKLYILGGFDINVASTNQIWEFDPTAGVGAKWAQKVNTPEAVMYAPTCTIGGIIYVAGASDFSGGLVIDTTNSFSFNPATNMHRLDSSDTEGHRRDACAYVQRPDVGDGRRESCSQPQQ